MPDNYELSNECKAWAMGAYGNVAGKFLIDHLPNAKSRQEASQIIAKAASLDTRIQELEGRTSTPYPSLYQRKKA